MNTKLALRVFFQMLLFALVTLKAATGDIQAQKSINPEEVLFIDFSVSGDDHSASALKPEQIKLSTGGKIREISYLSRIDPSSFSVSDPNSWIVVNQLRGSQSLIILLDLNSLDNAAMETARATVKSLLASIPDNSGKRFMLASLGTRLSFLKSFTPDKAEIIDSLDNIQAASKRLDYKSLIESIATIFTVQYRQDKDQALEESIREGNIFLVELRNRAEASVEGLGMFADWFKGLSGPKHVLFFSGGYPMRPGPVVQDILRTYNQSKGSVEAPSGRGRGGMGGGGDNISPGDTADSKGGASSDNPSADLLSPALLSAKLGSDNESVSSKDLEELIGKLNSNQLILYAFDSRDSRSDGLATSSVSGLPSQLVGRHNSSHITAGREFLKFITEPTRGSLISDPGEIEPAMTNGGDITYLAGIKADRKNRAGIEKSKVKIEINDTSGSYGEGLLLNIRSSPFPLNAVTSDEALAAVFNFPGYHHDFSTAFDYVMNKDEITGNIAVSPRELGFVKDKNSYICMLEVFGLLTDSEGKPVTQNKQYTFAKQFPLRMNADQYKDFLTRKTISASASAKGIKPGEYLLTMVVRQPRTGLLSASKMNVTVE